MNTPLDSARAYLAKLPAAISGAGGHNAALTAACWCVRFGLSDGDALALLREYNQRCQPAWTEKELAHKLAAARRKTTSQTQAIVKAPPAARIVWKLERKAPRACQPVVIPPPAEPPTPKAQTEPEPPALELTERHVIRPGEPIPPALLPVLQTWPALRQHPAWQCLQWPPEPRRMIAWNRRGEPIYARAERN